jgi:hypothetical protein
MEAIMELPIHKEVLEYYNKVKEVCPEALIAGGYLRDLDHNAKFFNDVDIFVRGTAGTLSSLYVALDKVFSPYYGAPLGRTYTETFNGIIYVLEYRIAANVDGAPINAHYNELKFQIIIMDHELSPLYLFDKFDLGVCKIAFDGQHVYRHEHYYQDCLNDIYSYYYSQGHLFPSEDRACRIFAHLSDRSRITLETPLVVFNAPKEYRERREHFRPSGFTSLLDEMLYLELKKGAPAAPRRPITRFVSVAFDDGENNN